MTFGGPAGTAAARWALSLRTFECGERLLLLRFLAERAVRLRELIERDLIARIQRVAFCRWGSAERASPAATRVRPSPTSASSNSG